MKAMRSVLWEDEKLAPEPYKETLMATYEKEDIEHHGLGDRMRLSGTEIMAMAEFVKKHGEVYNYTLVAIGAGLGTALTIECDQNIDCIPRVVENVTDFSKW